MDNMDFEDRNESIRKVFVIIAVLLFVIAACLFVYVFFFKNKDKKEEVKKEEGTTVIIEPKKEEEKKEEIVEILKTDYDILVESSTLFDTIGNYSIYEENKDGKKLSYLVNNETKSILSSGSDSYVLIPHIYNDLNGENECNLTTPSKCDSYVYHLNDSEYFINKKDNVISLNSYKKINSYFLDPNIENLYLCEFNDDVIFTFNGDELFEENSKFGILNTKTGLDYTEPKFKYIVEIAKDKFAGIIDSNVGLYNKNGEVILEPDYDFIGYIKSNDKTYITIKEDEVKFYDENLKPKKFNISDDMEINGLHSKYYQYFINNIYKVNINENDSFKYEGTDITGEKNVIIFNPGCNEYDEETQKYKDTKNSLIYVVDNNSLKKLDSSLVTPNDDLCDNWF